jgi:CRISPR-associated protein Cmr2
MPYLLALSVGPVQEFIAAARRTRDLWFGSQLLSEISKAAAKAVAIGGGTLIFPAPSESADLERQSPLNVANVIVAEVGAADPHAVAWGAKEAAQECWHEMARAAFLSSESCVDIDIWNDQVDDVIEFYSAWVPYTSQTYQASRATVMRLLAARKRCRDFLPAKGRAGVPKSSLDGLRESVIKKGSRSGRRLRLNRGEQLDAVGVVKRIGGNAKYPSVARVAADPWIRRLSSPQLRTILDAIPAGIFHEIDTSEARGQPQFASFPYEGTAVYRSRYDDIREEAGVEDVELAPLRKAIADLVQGCGEPDPYLGILVADGDKVGQAIAAITTPDEHRVFSRALADFAAAVRRVVNEHNGVLVYAGGDDIVAFVPKDRCLEGAAALRDLFDQTMSAALPSQNARPTLSIGVAVVHYMEPLEDLLVYGREAERHAKRPRPGEENQSERNALAVHVVKRGGAAIAMRMNWEQDPVAHLRRLASLLQDASVSGSVAYDMHRIARLYEPWPANIVRDVIQRDVLDVMSGKRPAGESRIAAIEELVCESVENAGSLRRLANDLLIARAFRPSFNGLPDK